MFYDKWQPELIDYMTNARNGHKYDFKVSNGESTSILGSKPDPYRGMPTLVMQNSSSFTILIGNFVSIFSSRAV